ASHSPEARRTRPEASLRLAYRAGPASDICDVLPAREGSDAFPSSEKARLHHVLGSAAAPGGARAAGRADAPHRPFACWGPRRSDQAITISGPAGRIAGVSRKFLIRSAPGSSPAWRDRVGT